MANTVRTDFIAGGVEKYISNLAAGENAFTKLSESASSSNLSVDFNKTATEISASLNGVKVGVDDLKKSTDSLKPTFGGAYVEESNRINEAFQKNGQSAQKFQAAAETAFNGTKSRVDAGAESLKEIAKHYAETAQGLNKPLSDGKSLSPLALASGKAHTELARLQTDIAGLNSALLKTTNKSVIKIINEDLAIAESRFTKVSAISDSLARKAIPVAPAASAAEPESAKKTSLGRLRGFGAIFREVDLGINETEINAGLAGLELLSEKLAAAKTAKTALTAATAAATAATTASTSATVADGAATVVTTSAVEAETVAFAALSYASLGVFAAVAAVAYAAVKFSFDYRAEAERNLEVQNKITGEINKQVLAVKESTRLFAEQRSNAERGDNFSRSTAGDSIQDLQRRKARLEESIRLNPKTEFLSGGSDEISKRFANDLANDRRELLEVESRIRNLPFEKAKAAEDAFNKNFDNNEKNRLQFEAKRLEREKQAFEKRAADIKTATGKAEELTKRYRETFDNLFVSTSKDNPFANLFSESDRAVNKLRENLKGLSPELRGIAEQLQKKADGDKLFSTRLNNDFEAFDLRNQANDLRNFGKDPNKPLEVTLDKRDPTQFFSDYVDFYTKKLEAEFLKKGGGATKFFRTADGGFSQVNDTPFTQFNRTANGGFSQSDARSALLNVYESLGSGGTFQRTKTFADLSQKEKFDFLNKDNIGLQNRLSSAFDLASNRSALNDTQKSEIDRKILSLSSGVNPSQLTDQQRDQVATAAENEAKRKENLENAGLKLQQDQKNIQNKIANFAERLVKIAETQGTKALDLRIIAGADVDYSYLPQRPQEGAKTDDYRIGDVHDAGSLYGSKVK